LGRRLTGSVLSKEKPMHLHHQAPQPGQAAARAHPHPVRDALSSAGDVFRDALLSISGTHHAEPWEQALARYEHDHPHAEPADR
jgi:hypothetical protein